MKWIVTVVLLMLLGIAGYLVARGRNPARPAFGDPTVQHYEYFARKFNNLMVDRGEPIEKYETDLKRTDSLTTPLVGDFHCIWAGNDRHIRFDWKGGKWVEESGRYQDLADAAQK
jgi:hypothetical protein